MPIKSVLIANRGEIAIRIAQAAAELGYRTISVCAEDDRSSRHASAADETVVLSGKGPSAYLDIGMIVEAALQSGCDAIHPGYGFLSENADFARACANAGLIFVGPDPEVLDLFANKAKARALAETARVPVLDGPDGEVTAQEAAAFFRTLKPGAAMILKAVSGGGGKGIRIVRSAGEVEAAFQACQAEAEGAFGYGGILAERFLERARHIEVQIMADGTGATLHLGERECSLQRRHQKIVEIAPCPGLSGKLRGKLTRAAVKLAKSVGYRNAGTFEFLVDGAEMETAPDEASFVFLEANPRVQVEHTITEEVMDVDIVQLQLRIAAGEDFERIGIGQSDFREANGFAIQMRVNLETMDESGMPRSAAGTVTRYELPSGKGVRVDGYGYAGYTVNLRYDSLIAKLIVHSRAPDFSAALAKASRALTNTTISGVATNVPFLKALLARPELAKGTFHTKFVDQALPDLITAADAIGETVEHTETPAETADLAGTDLQAIEGAFIVTAPMQGIVSDIVKSVGDQVKMGEPVVLIEAMKMVHAVEAPVSGTLLAIGVELDTSVTDATQVFAIDPKEDSASATPGEHAAVDLDEIRPDLAALLQRSDAGRDAARPEAVERRHRKGLRTARENIAHLCDANSFSEYGALTIAAQRSRRSEDDLIQNTPADGLIMGVGQVNGDVFGAEQSQCAIVSYDYTVLAGTQGHFGHKKKDRIFELAGRRKLPLILLSEGGGGRPGDTDVTVVAGMDLPSFGLFAALSGKVPLVGVNSGRCFAGNAALLGCCDVIIATENSSIGMGGPAMIEGGGLGSYKPEEVGPMSVQVPNGVVDIEVADEAEAIEIAKAYISYFQGTLNTFSAPDQRLLRHGVPANRQRSYDVRKIIENLCDEASVLELRAGYGIGIVTAIARIEGRAVAIMANNSFHLGGAIDGPAADKASRFMQLCDAFAMPLISLCDTPGFMVGPKSEATATVRRFARMFVTAAGMTVPMLSIVLRKAYGLGAMAMFGGNSHAPDFTASWPSGEFGGMGLEGAIQLAFRKELDAIEDAEARKRFFDEKVAQAYAFGGALNAAALFEIDAVIDPAETRDWIVSALRSAPPAGVQAQARRPHIDTW